MGGGERDNSDKGSGPVDSPADSTYGGGRERDRDRVITLVTEFDLDAEEAQSDDLLATATVLAGPGAGSSFALAQPRLVLGRDPAVEISINDPGLSRQHAEFRCQGSVLHIADLGSTNGTFVNGVRLFAPRRLAHGDRIIVGQSTVLGFALQDPLELETSQKLYERSVRDGLTQLYNRGHLNERMAAEFAYARRHRAPLCVLLLDLDHFKSINDTCGHAAGDEVLVVTARALLQVVRVEDLVARYGGEEFVVLARGIDVEGGVAFAERVRRTIAQLEIRPKTCSAPLRVTTSVGVAHTDQITVDGADALLAAADGALYEAKSSGRNRVVLANQAMSQRPAGPRRRRASRVMTSPLDRHLVGPGSSSGDGETR